jgi:hypothetical protein
MEPRLVEASPVVEQNRGQVAVMRGPVVYCVESADLPAGIDIDDVVLPVGAAWTVRHEPALLGGVTVLECEARVLPAGGAAQDLYRPARAGGRPFRLRMVPYYAWCNRGPGDMSVWLPAGR